MGACGPASGCWAWLTVGLLSTIDMAEKNGMRSSNGGIAVDTNETEASTRRKEEIRTDMGPGCPVVGASRMTLQAMLPAVVATRQKRWWHASRVQIRLVMQIDGRPAEPRPYPARSARCARSRTLWGMSWGDSSSQSPRAFKHLHRWVKLKVQHTPGHETVQ